MKNEIRIIDELIKRKYSKLRGRNTWVKGSWTVRFDEYDVEIFDAIDKTGRYLIENMKTVDISSILDEIEELIKK